MKKHGKLALIVREPLARFFSVFVHPKLSDAAKLIHHPFNFVAGRNFTRELTAAALDPARVADVQTALLEAYRAHPDVTLELMTKARAAAHPKSKAASIAIYLVTDPQALKEKDESIAWEVNQLIPGLSVTAKDVENQRRKIASKPYVKQKMTASARVVNPKDSRKS